jgi:uncharacterized protein involved in response to NO
LAILVLAWIAGRLAVYASATIGALVAGAIDILFLLLVAAATTREVVAGRNWRNLPPIFVVLIFLAGNVIFHVEDYETGTWRQALRRWCDWAAGPAIVHSATVSSSSFMLVTRLFPSAFS